MCRGFQQNQRHALNIKAFYVRLLFSTHQDPSHHSLTLHFPPRINAAPLEINGVNLRPDTPAFVTLHRVISGDGRLTLGAVYGSRERLRVSEGLRFEIYASNANKLLKGMIRKEEEGENWKLDCKSEVEEELVLSEAGVCVEVEGREAVMRQEVDIVSGGDKAKRRRSKCLQRLVLEEIPEQREEWEDWDRGCSCGFGDCDGDDEAGWRVVESGGDGCKMVEEVEMEGVRWAVDVGIWVVCLGVGYLVSKASSTRVGRQSKRLFLF